MSGLKINKSRSEHFSYLLEVNTINARAFAHLDPVKKIHSKIEKEREKEG